MPNLPVLAEELAQEVRPMLQPMAEQVVAKPAVQPVIEPAVQVPAVSAEARPEAPVIDEAQLAQRVMGALQKQVDSMIDFRLKEALAPVLARHADALVRELRDELSQTMRDVVSRAITQELAKLRQR
jgi:uncharacterized protein YicC (UPF0701 family)